MIPITRPVIGSEELTAIRSPLESGWLVQGPYVKQFEDRVADFCGTTHAVAASSCTTALHLALIAAGIKSGDRILVPSFTFIATANAVEHTGAQPVFIDIDPDTFNISIDALQKYLKHCKESNTPLPKALVTVHLFGLCADLPEIMALSKKYRFAVIEDAACALGSKIDGRAAGTFGKSACFSFHPRKIITTGEGGMIITDDNAVEKRLRILRDHGAEMSDHQRHQNQQGALPDYNHLGYNYRMTDLQGALGLAQMNKLPDIIKERQKLAARYDELLADLNWLKTPVCPSGYTHTYQSYVCRIDRSHQGHGNIGKVRSALMNHLKRSGIATVPGTHAVHLLGYYKSKYELPPEICPNARHAHYACITLPLYVGMTEEEQTYVVKSIRNFNTDFG